jgi:hypothetical protein
VSTKLSRPEPPPSADGSLLDVTGESQPEIAGDRGRGRTWRRAVGLLGAAAIVGVGVWVYSNVARERRAGTLVEIQPRPAATAPSLPDRPAAPPAPTPTPTPAAVPVSDQKPAPPAPAVPNAPPPSEDRARPAAVEKPIESRESPRKKQRRKSKAATEYTPDGVPIMP